MVEETLGAMYKEKIGPAYGEFMGEGRAAGTVSKKMEERAAGVVSEKVRESYSTVVGPFVEVSKVIFPKSIRPGKRLVTS